VLSSLLDYLAWRLGKNVRVFRTDFSLNPLMTEPLQPVLILRIFMNVRILLFRRWVRGWLIVRNRPLHRWNLFSCQIHRVFTIGRMESHFSWFLFSSRISRTMAWLK
jgi:hypothetical protein